MVAVIKLKPDNFQSTFVFYWPLHTDAWQYDHWQMDSVYVDFDAVQELQKVSAGVCIANYTIIGSLSLACYSYLYINF